MRPDLLLNADNGEDKVRITAGHRYALGGSLPAEFYFCGGRFIVLPPYG